MIFKDKIKYNGEIVSENQVFTFSTAEIGDAKQIAKMYSEVAINYNNYQSRLNPKNKYSFTYRGGMFIVFDEDGVRKEILNDHSFWAIIKNQQGDIVASFWFADNNDYFNDFKYQVNDKNVYPREIIVSERCEMKNVAKILYYTIFCAMEKLGYECSICDLYKVIKYEVDGQERNVGLLNTSSFNVMLNMKGTYMGSGNERQIDLNNLTIWIEPHVFLFKYNKSIPYYKEVLRQSNVEIIWR